jgi:hypothetical protein
MLRQPIESPAQLPRSLRKLGAYVAVALIVPGGSLIALTLWAWSYRGWMTPRAGRALLGLAALGTGLFFPG